MPVCRTVSAVLTSASHRTIGGWWSGGEHAAIGGWRRCNKSSVNWRMEVRGSVHSYRWLTEGRNWVCTWLAAQLAERAKQNTKPVGCPHITY